MNRLFHSVIVSNNMFYTSMKSMKTGFTEIPKRKGLPLIGTTLSILLNGSAPKLHLYIDKCHQKMGPIFKENMGTMSAIFISDPELMRQIFNVEGKYPKHFMPQPWIIFNEIHSCKRGLFFMDDDEWYHYRRLMNRHFLRNDIANLQNVHKVVVNHLISRWKTYDGGEIPDLEHEFYRHSISFLIGSLLGSSYVKEIISYEKDIERLASVFHNIFANTAKLNGKPVKLLAALSTPLWKKFEAAVQTSLQVCYEVVEKMMKNRSSDGLLYKLLNDNLQMNILVPIVADLILAAGDTTAITSQWSLYLLSKNTKIQEQLSTGLIDVRNVIKETLRMYPPAIFISRILPSDCYISGYKLYKGELVLLSLYTTGRNHNIYPSPNDFIPERWSRNDNERSYEGVNDPKGYIPFAIGARSCIGKNLALTQLHITINEIVSNFELQLQDEVDMILRLVPIPSAPLRIKLKSKL